MIASDRDGAITRTIDPGRSFGGTTGIHPFWTVPAAPGDRITGTVAHHLLLSAGRTGFMAAAVPS